MIGKKFLDERDKADCFFSAELHDLKYVISKNYWIFLITIALFIILIPFFTAGLAGDSIFNIEITHDQLKFRLIHEDTVLLVLAGCVLMGLVSAVASFRFIQDKQETTIFFSLGLTRRALFRNRCISGLLMLFFGISVPLVISMGLNIKALGIYEGLIRNTAYILIGLTVVSFVSFFVATIVCALAGTTVEAVIYWCGIMATPYGVCFCVNRLMKSLFWGNAHGVLYYSGTEMIRADLAEQLYWLNPVTFFYQELKTHAQFMRPLSSAVPPEIEPGVLIGWCVAAAVLLITGVFLFCRRKAETAGIVGANKYLSEWMINLSSFVIFTLVFCFLYSFNVGLALVFGIAGFAVVHLFWRKAFFSFRTSFKKNIGSFAVGACISLLLSAAFFTGGFHSLQRTLDHSEMVQAKISYVGAPSYLYEPAVGSSTGRGYYLTSQLMFTDADDIALVKELQQRFIDSGKLPMESDEEDFKQTVVPYDITFEYTDDRGEEYIWYYDRATLSQLEQILQIENTTAAASGRKALFEGKLESEQTVWASEAYRQGTIYITDKYYSNTYELELSEEQRQELLAAIEQDQIQGNFSDKYFPKRDTAAVLMFSQNGEYDCEYYAYNLDNAFVYLTEKDTNTLAWLKQHQLLELVSGNAVIESITLQRFDPYIGINEMKYPMGMYFMSYRAETLDEFLIQKDFGNKYTITDKEKISQLGPNLRNGYFMSGGGYLAAVKIAGADGYVYMFLPSDQVPGFVKG